MRSTKCVFGAVVLGLLFPFVACADMPGIGAGAFLRRGVDARALGMGGAHVAVVDGYAAMYWNPAGLARAESWEVGGTTSDLFGLDIRLNFLAAALPWTFVFESESQMPSETSVEPRGWRVGLGLSFTEMATEVRAYDEWGNPLGLIRYSEALYGLGLGAWVPRLGHAGIVVKAYNFRAPRAGVGGADATAFGIGFDAGIVVPVWQGLWLGLAAADIGNTSIQWRNTPLEPTDLVSARYTGGLAYFARGLFFEEDRLVAAFDVTFEPLVGTQAMRGGMEYSLLFLSLRAGAVWREGVPLSFTAGVGVRARGLAIDAAWVQNRELQVEGAGHTIVLSAGFRF